MRALKNNWLRAGITLLFLLGAFFVLRAMEKKEVKETILVTTFHFKGSTLEQATDPSFWSDDPNDAQICDGEEELPCSLNLSVPIENYLQGKTKEQIMADPNVNKRSR